MRVFNPLSLLLLVVAALAPASVQAAAPETRVMTFNLRYATAPDGENAWEKRKELLADTIREFHPDLLGTQEVLALQADYVVEHIKGYTLVGVGRDDGKRGGEFSSIFYKSSRYEPIDSGTFWLSETPDKPGSKSWDSSLPRIATWVKLRDRDNGNREICFLNTHWDHRGNQARIESAKMIRKWVADHAAGTPTIVTGDLNVNPDHPGYRTLTGTEGSGPVLRDAYRLVHPEPVADEATFNGFNGTRRGKRIDFILCTSEWTPREAAINYANKDGRYPSDHYPVTAVLELAK